MVSVDRWSQLPGCYELLEWFTDQPTVVSIDRWSQLPGCCVLLEWFTDQPTVVSVDRRSFFTGYMSKSQTKNISSMQSVDPACMIE